MQLKNWPFESVRVHCRECGLETELPTKDLVAVFGEDTLMFDVREILLEDECKETNAMEVCKAKLTDALLANDVLNPVTALHLSGLGIERVRHERKRLGLRIPEKELPTP